MDHREIKSEVTHSTQLVQGKNQWWYCMNKMTNVWVLKRNPFLDRNMFPLLKEDHIEWSSEGSIGTKRLHFTVVIDVRLRRLETRLYMRPKKKECKRQTNHNFSSLFYFTLEFKV
jgi:hypothetical protein